MSEETVESTDFKIFQYQHNGTSTTRLIVFCPTNRNLCYEYYQHHHNFICCYCPLEKQITATVCKNENGTNYLVLCKSEHVCDLREFDSEKFKDDIAINKSLYELTSTAFPGGTKQKNLILFTNVNKTFYYKFAYDPHKKRYCCSQCRYQKLLFAAFVYNEGKENECVYVSRQTHICQPVDSSLSFKNDIIMAPNFQLIKRKSKGKIIQKLAIFINEDKRECYEYTWSEKDKYFICNTCTRAYKTYVYAKLFKNDDNEECIELCKISHKCSPIKFIPEDLTSKIIRLPDFKLWEDKNKKKLIIYDPNNQKLGYIYVYRETTKNYVCIKCCHGKKKHVTAKLCQDDKNDQQYLELNDAEHVCEPVEHSSLVFENSIIKTTNFQLIKRKSRGKIIQKLAIFINEEKSECYEYTWSEKYKCFVCHPCTKPHKTYLFAKLLKNDENEEYVQLCNKAHKCKPIEFLPENITTKIVKQDDFKLWEDTLKKKKLTIYDPSNQKLGYIYFFCQAKKKYVCTKCNTRKKCTVTAKLLQDKNGQNYLELSDAEHICEIQKF